VINRSLSKKDQVIIICIFDDEQPKALW